MVKGIKETKISISSSALSDHMRLERPRVQMNFKDFNRREARNYWKYKLVRSVSLKMVPAVVNSDFGFREVKHLLIIFSLYRFEFHKTLIFTVFEMSNFVLTKQHLWEILIFCFNWKKSAAEAHRMLVEVYNDTAPIDKSCREWFRRFKDGDFSVEDKGQPKKFEDKELEALLKEDQSQLISY